MHNVEDDTSKRDMIPRDEGKLWGAFRELRAWVEGEIAKITLILTGVGGTNGINGKLKELEADHELTKRHIRLARKEIRTSRAWGRRLWEVKRPEECIGAKLVRELRAELQEEKAMEAARLATLEAERRKEKAEVRKALIGLYGAIAVALITSASNLLAATLKK